ncbi:outer membrane protein assembly factor BamC [Marinobacter bryozoorum]|uniref:outer membrane protein assembly factor BamC n=1 Tax=Marinobacter bryozoorum TaxID=256324 RepID=UPI002002DF3B|nr:outer membrane protein assembly factor BamC [Marinobacter bryozoorum]MCK7544160.1 outer membrane protein assembly factor BamC [Marinobacter bryozoorum]
MSDRFSFLNFRPRVAILGVAMAGLLVSGCSLVNDRSDDYATAEQSRPLKGIDGQPLPRQRPAFPVREVQGSGTLGAQVPEPPDLTADILDENYVVESVDDQSWLLVNEVPGRIWPAVAAWMNETGLAVAVDSTQLGLMQSEVANFSRRARGLVGLDEASADEPRIVVQVRLAPGVRRKTTEVQIRPRAVAANPEGLLPWQDEPMNQSLEDSLLENLSTFLQSREDNRAYSRAALAMGSESRVSLLEANTDRDQAIAIDLPYDRVWGEIRRVLEDESIPVLDLDRTAGYFLVDGRPEEDRRRGWMTRWFAGDEVEPEVTNRIQLSEEDGQVVVTAERADGYDGGNYSRSLITRLYDYLY